MKYNIHNIWKSNAPPGKGNSFPAVIPKFYVISNPDSSGEKSEASEQNDNRFLAVPSPRDCFGMTSTGGRSLLKMRDGPRGREPDAGVPVTLIPSVKLCEFSVDSVVKNVKPQRTRRRHREHGVIDCTLKTKTFRWNCNSPKTRQVGNYPLAGENVFLLNVSSWANLC